MKSNIASISFSVYMVAVSITACSGISGKTQQNRTPLPTATNASTAQQQTKTQNAQSSGSPAPSPIRQVDFRNFSFPKLPTGKCSANEIHLINGRYDAPEGIAGKRPAVDCWSVVIGPIYYGDVTGDGEEDAIVDLYAELGGTEGSQDVYIYTMQGGNPVLLWKFATGDRADGGPRRIYAENGVLVVELFGIGTAIGKKLYGTENVGACCPNHYTRTRYKWVKNRFQQEGKREVLLIPTGDASPVKSKLRR